MGNGWTEWHDNTLDEFLVAFNRIPTIIKHEKRPDKIRWTFQFEDFVVDEGD